MGSVRGSGVFEARSLHSREKLAQVGRAGVGVAILFDGRKSIEKELAHVGLGHGVAAVNALAGQQLEEIAEKDVDGVGAGEVLEIAEKFIGDGFFLLARFHDAEMEMIRAKRSLGIGYEHAAAMAASVDVLAVRLRRRIGRHRKSFPDEPKTGEEDERRPKRLSAGGVPPCDFCKDVILRELGCKGLLRM